MKNILLFICALTFNVGYSQERNFEDHLHETSPVFPGCENAQNRHYCYIQKVSEAVRDKINESAKDIPVNDIKVELLLRNEKDGKTTVLKLKTDNLTAEQAAREALTALPLIKPQPVNGTVGASSAGFVVILHRNLPTEPFEVVVNKPKHANMPHPADLNMEDVVFPGCENVSKEDRRVCFSQNFNTWLLSRLPKNINSRFPNQNAIIMLTFGPEGTLNKLVVNCKSDELKDILENILKSCPKVTPATDNGEKSSATYTVPVYFR